MELPSSDSPVKAQNSHSIRLVNPLTPVQACRILHDSGRMVSFRRSSAVSNFGRSLACLLGCSRQRSITAPRRASSSRVGVNTTRARKREEKERGTQRAIFSTLSTQSLERVVITLDPSKEEAKRRRRQYTATMGKPKKQPKDEDIKLSK